MIRTASIVGAIILTLCGWRASAEPGPTINYLMNGNVSLFSFGLYRLGVRLNSDLDFMKQIIFNKIKQNRTAGLYVDVVYDWDRNVIVAQYNYLEFEKAVENSMLRSICSEIIRLFRINGGVSEGGNISIKGASSGYSRMFSDLGFKRASDPKDHLAKIDTIIEATSVVRSSHGAEAPEQSVTCRGQLLSGDTFYSN